MIQTQLSILDAAVIGIMLLSSLFAFFRGFVREVLSLGAWIGAGLVTIYYFPYVSEALRPHFKSQIGAVGISTLGIYTVALLCFSLVNMLILKFVKSGSDVGILDNTLGLIFGLFRGAVIIALGFFLFTIAVPEREYPQWLTTSQTYPYVEKSAAMLASVAPEYLREISTLKEKIDDQQVDLHSGDGMDYDRLNTEQTPAAGATTTTIEDTPPVTIWREEGQ
jgi:membrane protein required for colicin V production